METDAAPSSDVDVPQSVPLNETQVCNNAGGFVFKIDDFARLRRFVILGSNVNNYYISNKDMELQNAECVLRLLADGQGERVVEEVQRISSEGRAPRQSPGIFVLAICARLGDAATRRAALAALPAICRTASTLFELVQRCKELGDVTKATRQGAEAADPATVMAWLAQAERAADDEASDDEASDDDAGQLRPHRRVQRATASGGDKALAWHGGKASWGRAMRRAVALWYLDKAPVAVAYQATKYSQRNGWSHADLLRLAHPDPEEHAAKRRKLLVDAPGAAAPAAAASGGDGEGAGQELPPQQAGAGEAAGGEEFDVEWVVVKPPVDVAMDTEEGGGGDDGAAASEQGALTAAVAAAAAAAAGGDAAAMEAQRVADMKAIFDFLTHGTLPGQGPRTARRIKAKPECGDLEQCPAAEVASDGATAGNDKPTPAAADAAASAPAADDPTAAPADAVFADATDANPVDAPPADAILADATDAGPADATPADAVLADATDTGPTDACTTDAVLADTADAGPADTAIPDDAPDDAVLAVLACAGPADAAPADAVLADATDAGPADTAPAEAAPNDTVLADAADADPADTEITDAAPADAAPADAILADAADAGPADAAITDAAPADAVLADAANAGSADAPPADTVLADAADTPPDDAVLADTTDAGPADAAPADAILADTTNAAFTDAAITDSADAPDADAPDATSADTDTALAASAAPAADAAAGPLLSPVMQYLVDAHRLRKEIRAPPPLVKKPKAEGKAKNPKRGRGHVVVEDVTMGEGQQPQPQGQEQPPPDPAAVAAHAAAEAEAVELAVSLVRRHRFGHEHVGDTVLLRSPEVWSAFLEVGMPLTAMIRNLGRMTQLGVMRRPDCLQRLTARLQDPRALAAARVHPMSLLEALCTYRKGAGARGVARWEAEPSVCAALEAAFYLAFKNVTPTGKRYLAGLDVSGSMCSPCGGMTSISCHEATAAMLMSVVRSEPWLKTMAFSHELVPMELTPDDRLEEVLERASAIPMGGTDCALPMLYALQQRLPVDVFLVLTDNETWFGGVHPAEALRRYRDTMGMPETKLVVMAFSGNQFSIADPADAGMLDVAGLDSAVPRLVADFVCGRL